jgi:hypothetical protein
MLVMTGSWLDGPRLRWGLTTGLVAGATLAFSADRPPAAPTQESSSLAMSLTLPESPAHESFTAESAGPSDSSPESPAHESFSAQSAGPSDSSSGHQLGIPFGMYHLPETEFAPPFTSALRNGSDPADVIPVLDAARKAGIKVYLNMFVSRRHIQNPDGSFSLDRWKQRIDRFQNLGLEPYITDGTLAGNYLMDEPDSRGKWNGQSVPFADIEAAAAYSKQLWPGLTTMIRADPLFLQKAPFRWVYLDAAWAQYTNRKGAVEDYARRHAAAAKALGLGLVVGLNLLDGGDGSSGLEGTKVKYSAMSAEEVMHYGSVLLREPGACALLLWKYDREDRAYFLRPEIRAALETVGLLAATHPASSCKVR